MTNEFTNRLDSFRTTLTFLDQPANRALWFNQAPARFTTRVADAQDAVAALAEFCREQETIITGAAEDKAREQAELEVAAHALGLAVAECSRTLGNETDAAKADFSLSTWRRMRDATLLATARQVILLAQGLLTGQPATAAECGITAATIASTTKEADDFEAIINAPQGGHRRAQSTHRPHERSVQCGGSHFHQPRQPRRAVPERCLCAGVQCRTHQSRSRAWTERADSHTCADTSHCLVGSLAFISTSIPNPYEHQNKLPSSGSFYRHPHRLSADGKSGK